MANQKRKDRKEKRKRRNKMDARKPQYCQHRVVIMGTDVGQCANPAGRCGYCYDHMEQHGFQRPGPRLPFLGLF